MPRHLSGFKRRWEAVICPWLQQTSCFYSKRRSTDSHSSFTKAKIINYHPLSRHRRSSWTSQTLLLHQTTLLLTWSCSGLPCNSTKLFRLCQKPHQASPEYRRDEILPSRSAIGTHRYRHSRRTNPHTTWSKLHASENGAIPITSEWDFHESNFRLRSRQNILRALGLQLRSTNRATLRQRISVNVEVFPRHLSHLENWEFVNYNVQPTH